MPMSGNKLYTIEYLEVVVKEDIPVLPTSAKKMIQKAIEERLTVDPVGFGKPLRCAGKISTGRDRETRARLGPIHKRR